MYGIYKFIIDKEDMKKCSEITWSLYHPKNRKGRRSYYYGQSNKSIKTGKKSMLLHRFIMDAPPEKDVDHINFDTFDNRKSNLRLCDRHDNVSHGRGRCDNTSGTIGVTWNKRGNNWMAYIYLNTKFKNLGCYNNIKDAIKVRKAAEDKYFGEFKPVKEVS